MVERRIMKAVFRLHNAGFALCMRRQTEQSLLCVKQRYRLYTCLHPTSMFFSSLSIFLCTIKILLSFITFNFCIIGQQFLSQHITNGLIERLQPKSGTHYSHGIEIWQKCVHFNALAQPHQPESYDHHLKNSPPVSQKESQWESPQEVGSHSQLFFAHTGSFCFSF